MKYNMSGVWQELKLDEEQLMYQFSTMLRAGTCEYELEYTVKEEHREAYFIQRKGFFELLSPSQGNPQPVFQRLPGDSCVSRGRYLKFETQGRGAFGWVTQGVDIETGDPIAIKELRIDCRRSRLEVMAEVRMGSRFLVSDVDT